MSTNMLNIEDIDSKMDVISTDSFFKGDFAFGEMARIDGRLEGHITSSGLLIVGVNAKIKADIAGQTIVVMGLVEGNIRAAKMLLIEEHGKVIGNTSTPTLSIKNGGKINGEIYMSQYHPESKLFLEQA
jgi:cytoskeletal protein CcmA (bactofilin family)